MGVWLPSSWAIKRTGDWIEAPLCLNSDFADDNFRSSRPIADRLNIIYLHLQPAEHVHLIHQFEYLKSCRFRTRNEDECELCANERTLRLLLPLEMHEKMIDSIKFQLVRAHRVRGCGSNENDHNVKRSTGILMSFRRNDGSRLRAAPRDNMIDIHFT